MGVLKDLGTGTVWDICPETGYPRTKRKHLLNPLDPHYGLPVQGWGNRGTELYHLTNPYGRLEYGIGSGDDFHCFDFALINAGSVGEYFILEATVNSESAGFIDNAGYALLPARSLEEYKTIIEEAESMVGTALDWLVDSGKPIRHDRKGWNQDPRYFVRSVAQALQGFRFEGIPDRQMRMGGKRVDRIVEEISCRKILK